MQILPVTHPKSGWRDGLSICGDPSCGPPSRLTQPRHIFKADGAIELCPKSFAHPFASHSRAQEHKHTTTYLNWSEHNELIWVLKWLRWEWLQGEYEQCRMETYSVSNHTLWLPKTAAWSGNCEHSDEHLHKQPFQSHSLKWAVNTGKPRGDHMIFVFLHCGLCSVTVGSACGHSCTFHANRFRSTLTNLPFHCLVFFGINVIIWSAMLIASKKYLLWSQGNAAIVKRNQRLLNFRSKSSSSIEIYFVNLKIVQIYHGCITWSVSIRK